MASWRFAVGCTGKRVTMFFLWRYKKSPFGLYVISGDSLGIRTLDPLIKSQMLYQIGRAHV